MSADNLPGSQVQISESLWTRQRGNDWPRMLGPNYDSRSEETGILKSWPASGLRLVWTHDTGKGYGNGVASLGRWFQFDRYNDVERLTCLNAETGQFLWKWESPVEYHDAYGYNNGPRCSPVADGDRVYIYGVTGTLACLSAVDGKLLWQRSINDEYSVFPNFFGVGASPLIYQDKLLVMVGGSPKEKHPRDITQVQANGTAMVAFDKATGKELYRVGNYLASYSAPVIASVGGQEMCLALVREGLLAFDPKDGSNEQFFPWRAKTIESVNAASPVVWNDCILISETYERGSALVKLTNKGFERLWRDGSSRKDQLLRCHWSTPLLEGDVIYASSGRNAPDTDLRCLKLTDGSNTDDPYAPELHWFNRNHDRMTGLIVDQHLLLLGESGLLQLLELNSKKMTVVADMSLDTAMDPRDKRPLIEPPSWAPPVLSHGLLYLRGDTKVVCLELIEP